jgi:hypothetical protein
MLLPTPADVSAVAWPPDQGILLTPGLLSVFLCLRASLSACPLAGCLPIRGVIDQGR